jgi:hypothetical protein
MILQSEEERTNLYISKELRRLGVRQESWYYHVEIKYLEDGDTEQEIMCKGGIFEAEKDAEIKILSVYSAYTLAEIFHLIPLKIDRMSLRIYKEENGKYGAVFENDFFENPNTPYNQNSKGEVLKSPFLEVHHNPILVNLLGMILVNLLKNGYVLAKKINQS